MPLPLNIKPFPIVPCNRYCTRLSWTLVKQKGKKIVISRLACKSWKCPYCGPRRKKALQFLARSGRPNRFITLTHEQANGLAPEVQAQRLSRAWKKARRWLRTRFRIDGIEFLAVFEKTKAGNPHLHVLVRAPYIPQNVLSDLMKRYIDSPIVDVRRVRSKKQAALYVSKYIAKDPERFKGTKRYWRTTGWANVKRSPRVEKGEFPDIYYVLKHHIVKIGKFMASKGFALMERTQDLYYFWPKPNPPPILPGHRLELAWSPTSEEFRPV